MYKRQILGHVNKTKATVCGSNRKALEDSYVLQRAVGMDTSMNELLTNADGKYFEQKMCIRDRNKPR